MYKGSLKLIFRRLIQKPLYPSITIIGLILGFVSTILIGIWLRDEFSYDSYNSKADRVYRLTVELNNEETNFHWDFARSWFGWLKNIKEEVPGIESLVRISRWQSGVVKVNDRVWQEDIFYADSTFTDIFSLHFLEGNPQSCLSKPRQVILDKSIANKFFKGEDPVYKIIYLYCSSCKDQIPYQVTGVFDDIPPNAHVHFHIIGSFEKPEEELDWAYYYLLLAKNTKPGDILRNFKSFSDKYRNPNSAETRTPHLQRITDIHLFSAKERELEVNGNMLQIKIIFGLTLFMLFISLFNYFNLRYIHLLKDSKPVKVFKILGAKTKNVFLFLLSETFVYSLIAAIGALVIVALIFPYFNELMGKQPFAGRTILLTTASVCMVGLIILSSIIGVFPFVVLRLKGIFKGSAVHSHLATVTAKGRGLTHLLKVLLGIQYISTFVLIVAIIVVNGQIRLFMQNNLGNNEDGLLCIEEIPCQVINKYEVFREEVLKNPVIKEITSSMQDPGDEIQDMFGFETTGVDEDTSNNLLYVCPVDDNFFTFYHIPVVAGQNFPENIGNDSIPESFILNEKAVEYLGWKNHEAIGKPFRLINQYMSQKPGRIVGIVSNFQPSSMQKEIKPYVFFQKSFWQFSVQVRYDTSKTAEAIQYLGNTWNQIYPDYPFKYEFVENIYKKIYKNEFHTRNIGLMLCILALILSATGLFALTGIVYESRTKEIGIRKVNGAGIPEIIAWLLKDVLIIIAGSLAVAVPLSYSLAKHWLNHYVYKISPEAWIFVLGSFILLFFAVFTVGWQTWRAAVRNPVESLRYE
jgi:putative ABC transport system permease protein